MAAAALLVAILAASLLVSELLRLGPANMVDDWSGKDDLASFSRWDETASVLRKAAALNPLGPEADYDLARLYDWRAITATGGEAADYRQQAIHYYRSAIDRRPRYGAAWALLAKVYWQDGRFIPEGIAAWRRGIELAPYEFDTSTLLVSVGLANWNRLPKTDQAKLVGILRYRQERNERFLLPIDKSPLVLTLIKHGSLDVLKAGEGGE